MKDQDVFNYNRIAEAIQYLEQNFRKQPSLEDVAAVVHLSPFHFQRLFKDWAGVTPNKFMRFLSVEYAKEVLVGRDLTLFDTAEAIGLSGTGRLHDLFVTIEGMTPGEYRNGGRNLVINYDFMQSQFGVIIMASTEKGICHLAFIENEEEGFRNLVAHFPQADFRQSIDDIQRQVVSVFRHDWENLKTLKLHLFGSPFQLKVWNALLKIPLGALSTYGNVAKEVDKPKAARAVGTAIGSNPVAFLIPCHRVIRATGERGGYMWGSERKSAMIGWEAASIQ